MKNRTKAFILALIMFLSGTFGSYGTYYLYKHNKEQLLIQSELKYEDSNKALDDMFSTDENEIQINVSDNSQEEMVAYGTDLYSYLINNKIKLLFLNGTWYSNEAMEIQVPSSMYENDMYYYKENESIDFKPRDKNDMMNLIITTPYKKLKPYDVYKLLRYNDKDKYNKYAESYYLG